jgi:hypothetical protein
MSVETKRLDNSLSLERRAGNVLAVRFSAMACPCELLVHTQDADLSLELGAMVAAEAWRIEGKYSRYRSDSVTSTIHRQPDRPLRMDEETAALLNFARQCRGQCRESADHGSRD